MRRHDELMERLAAADPVRDREELTPEEQREADALLARLLATPVEPAATPRRPRQQLRRRALAVAGAACAALAGFAAIDLLDSDAPGPSVVDRAVAAVTRGGVYHVVELITLSEPPLEISAEAWYTSDGRQHRMSFKSRDGKRGKLMEDFAGWRRPGRGVGPALRWDPISNTIAEGGFARDANATGVDPFADPGSHLRALEKEGRLHAAGTTTVDGKRAYRLVSDTVDGEEIEITVDAQTYLPLSQRVTVDSGRGQKFEALTRYLVYERVALNDETERRLALAPHPGAKCSEFARELTEKRDLGFPNPCAK